MSGNKYRVEKDKQFLGHWAAHTPTEAVKKAYDANHQFYDLTSDSLYEVHRGRDVWLVSMKGLCDER